MSLIDITYDGEDLEVKIKDEFLVKLRKAVRSLISSMIFLRKEIIAGGIKVSLLIPPSAVIELEDAVSYDDGLKRTVIISNSSIYGKILLAHYYLHHALSESESHLSSLEINGEIKATFSKKADSKAEAEIQKILIEVAKFLGVLD